MERALQEILNGDQREENFAQFLRLLVDKPLDEQKKLCAEAAPVLQTWPWEIRKLNPRTYWLDAETGVLACTGHLHFERCEIYTGAYINDFLLNPDAQHLRGISFQSVETLPQAFHWLTRSPHLGQLTYLSFRKAELSELDICLGGDALVSLQELIIRDDIHSPDLELLPQLPLLNPVKYLTIGLHHGLTNQFLLNMMQASCWAQLVCFHLHSTALTKEKVDFMIANWVHPGPRRLCIQGTPAANEPNPAWAAYGIEWEGESKM